MLLASAEYLPFGSPHVTQGPAVSKQHYSDSFHPYTYLSVGAKTTFSKPSAKSQVTYHPYRGRGEKETERERACTHNPGYCTNRQDKAAASFGLRVDCPHAAEQREKRAVRGDCRQGLLKTQDILHTRYLPRCDVCLFKKKKQPKYLPLSTVFSLIGLHLDNTCDDLFGL